VADGDESPRPIVEAAIDIGSNSVHLLVGMVTDHAVTPLADESALLGLGDVVDAEGRLPFGARGGLLEALDDQAALARRWQARDLVVLGTEPLRRAADRDEIAAAVLGRIGCRLDVLSHAEEAELTLLGVTHGAEVPDRLLVVDIGGGSSEWAVAAPGAAPVAGVLATGSRRLTAACASADPPTAADVTRLREEARRLMEAIVAPPVDRAIFTGGTATNLLKLLAALDPTPPERLTMGGVEATLTALTGASAAATAERYSVTPTRARLLPAGAALTLAVLDAFGLSEAGVSDASLREGAVLALARAGGAWRQRLPRLTHGWRGQGEPRGR
jgi:exopolyphosphatase/guanosine-5'-triphosphate,3'-diphosphate pyrophosphatase